MLTATRPASPVPRPRAATLSSPVRSGWKPDLLVVCVAIYIATAVGRLHEVFPVLGYFKPTLLSAGLALGLYLLDRSRMRAPGRLLSPTATYVIGLVVWGALTVPGALNQGAAAHGRHRAAGAHLLRGDGRVRGRRAVPLSAGSGELATRTAVLLRRQRSGDAHRDGASAGHALLPGAPPAGRTRARRHRSRDSRRRCTRKQCR